MNSQRTTALTLIALTLLLLAALAGGGHTLEASPTQAGCAPSWVEIRRKDISFQFPARISSTSSYLPNVPNLDGDMYRASSGSTKYIVRIIRDGGTGLPAQTRFQKFRDIYRQSLVAANGDGRTRFVSKGNEPLDGFTGEQTEVVSGSVRMALHLYLRGDSLYSLEVTPIVEGDALAECFFSSFNFLETPHKTPTPYPPISGGGGGIQKLPTPPTPTPKPTPTLTPTPTPTPELVFSCECGQNLVKEVPGNRNEHTLVICEHPEMCYPKWVADEGIEGSGKILVKYPATGTPQVVNVVVSLHPALDQCAIQAIQQTSFCPETHDGVAEDVLVETPFKFDLIRRTVEAPPPTVRKRRP